SVGAGRVRRANKVIERRIALAQRDDMLLVAQNRQQLAEAPNAALVFQFGGGAALFPEPPQGARIGHAAARACGFLLHLSVPAATILAAPGGVFDLVQIAALGAAKI